MSLPLINIALKPVIDIALISLASMFISQFTQLLHKILSLQVTVTFPYEAIRGINFSSAQVDAFPHHEWPEATSDGEIHPRVLRKC